MITVPIVVVSVSVTMATNTQLLWELMHTSQLPLVRCLPCTWKPFIFSNSRSHRYFCGKQPHNLHDKWVSNLRIHNRSDQYFILLLGLLNFPDQVKVWSMIQYVLRRLDCSFIAFLLQPQTISVYAQHLSLFMCLNSNRLWLPYFVSNSSGPWTSADSEDGETSEAGHGVWNVQSSRLR